MRIRASFTSLLLSAVPALAVAQVSVTSDATVGNAYVWRGLTTTNRLVVQPDLLVSATKGSNSLLVGGWMNIEPARYNAPTEISQGGGTHAFDPTEVDLWAEYTRTAGIAGFTLGGLQYIFPNSAGVTDASNTFEVYGKLGLQTVLSPKLALYRDVGKVRGIYMEGSVAQAIPVGSRSLTLGALAGMSAGEHYDSLATHLWYYQRDGLTHLDLSATMGFEISRVTVAPAVHVYVDEDPMVKAVAPGTSRRAKVLFGTTLSWTRVVVPGAR